MKYHYTNAAGESFEWEQPDPPQSPLEGVSVVAALLAVVGVVSVQDAANAVGQTPEALMAEAQAWFVAANMGGQ